MQAPQRRSLRQFPSREFAARHADGTFRRLRMESRQHLTQ